MPQSFTVRDKKWVRVTVRIVGVLIAVFFTALLAGVIGSSIDEPEGWSLAETVGFSAFALVFAVFGVFLIFHVRRRLVVEGGVAAGADASSEAASSEAASSEAAASSAAAQ